MPDFTDLFIQAKGQPIEYKGKIIQMMDKLPVQNGDILSISIESTNSQDRQGFSIDITGYCKFNEKVYKQGKGVNMLFWEDTCFNEIRLIIFTKKDFICVKNIWELKNYYSLANELGQHQKQSSKSIGSWYGGAAMIVEKIEKGRRYRCNDGEPDDDFDDIIFTVKNLGNIRDKQDV